MDGGLLKNSLSARGKIGRVGDAGRQSTNLIVGGRSLCHRRNWYRFASRNLPVSMSPSFASGLPSVLPAHTVMYSYNKKCVRF